MQLDRIDRKILSVLQREARITNQALAARVDLSPSSCLNRVKKLESAGVIGPYLAVLDLPRLCRSVTVIATVSLKDPSSESFRMFEAALKEIPEVVECDTVSGVFDFFLRIVAPDMVRYNQIVDRLFDLIPGKVNMSSHVVLEQGKPFRGFPLNELLEE